MPQAAKRVKQKGQKNAKLGGAHLRPMMPLDWPFAILVLILVVFGLVMVFSASYATAYYRKGDSFFYIRKQAFFAVAGIILMFIISTIDYHILFRWAYPFLGLTLVLLVIVFAWDDINDAHRWITVPFVNITIQPSEFAKLAVVLVFARIISLNQEKMKTFLYGVVPFLLILIVIAGLVIAEPHLSGTILILGIGVVMMFVGGTGLVWFATALGGLLAAGGAVFLMFPSLVERARSRLDYWIDPFIDAKGKGHQTIQSLYAIGSGGILGLGIGNSRQKHLYVPEPANDFIFSILCEELGFVGAMIVILLFVFLLMRGIIIAYRAKDKFGSMIVIGITTQIILQAVLNIAVVTKTIPNTGISLPFFSYGGTSLMMLLMEIGIILNVSRQAANDKV